MSKPAKSYEQQVREALVKSGRTSADLNGKTGLHPTTIRRFRTGKLRLRSETLDKLAEELGLKPSLVPA
jgi:ribosome-binding protein aMBF1 (putative translation factor)